MAQNKSHAVMAQRVEPHDSLDDFPTQPWATRALVEHVILPTYADDEDYVSSFTAWEPACNRGHMVRPLREYFYNVHASDVHDYGCGYDVHDYLFPIPPHYADVDWVITNPPFRLAEQFIDKSFTLNLEGIAMIVRTSFLESIGRYERPFVDSPPNIIAQFAERVPMVKGRLTAKGSTATAYCWLVWKLGGKGTRFQWIPPCRKQLERVDDYVQFGSEPGYDAEAVDG